MYINILLQINEIISDFFSKILKQHGSSEEEIRKITGDLTEFPSCYRTKLFKVAKKSAKNPLWAHQRQAELLLTLFTYSWLLFLYNAQQPASRFKKAAIPLRSLHHCVPVR